MTAISGVNLLTKISKMKKMHNFVRFSSRACTVSRRLRIIADVAILDIMLSSTMNGVIRGFVKRVSRQQNVSISSPTDLLLYKVVQTVAVIFQTSLIVAALLWDHPFVLVHLQVLHQPKQLFVSCSRLRSSQRCRYHVWVFACNRA